MNPLFTLRAMLVGALIAGSVGIFTGWRTASWYYGLEATKTALAAEKAKTAALTENLRLIREALGVDAKQAVIDATNEEEMKRHAEEIVKAIEARPALSAADVDRLRDYFERHRP